MTRRRKIETGKKVDAGESTEKRHKKREELGATAFRREQEPLEAQVGKEELKTNKRKAMKKTRRGGEIVFL